ncbi:lysozyme inhibitor LprI family protein [Herbaspirillum sp. NPDC087042]|uniref:lysozyme inhibitor LprI family protein n=1 Tax=Herbaspirillum sp. NPDC087042 TaxID=3364004 RepID=UPI003812EF81
MPAESGGYEGGCIRARFTYSNNKGKSKVKRIIVGISLIVSSALVHAASFDCAKASTKIEKAICGDEQLSKLDSDLMTAYKVAQTSATDPNKLKSEQKAWLQASRNKCEDARCIKTAYEDRINALKSVEVTAPVAQPAPEAAVVKNESPPDVKQEEKPAEAVAPAVAPEPTPQVQTSEPSNPSKSTPVDEPTSTVADILFGVAGLIGIALVTGLIKPKLVIRWSDKPTRLKVLGYLLPALLIVSFAAPMSRTKDRAEYDKKVAAEQKSKREQEEKEKQQQRVVKKDVSPQQASQSSNGDSVVQGYINRFNVAERDFLLKLKAAKESRSFNDPNYYGCRQMANAAFEAYKKEINRTAEFAKSGQPDLFIAALNQAMTTFAAYGSNVSSSCQ